MKYHFLALALAALAWIIPSSRCQSEQQTSFEFYMHDNVFVSNPSGIPVAGANGSTTTFAFGTVIIIDDALTLGPSPTSTSLGRAQGTYLVTSLDASTILLTFTAVFSDRNGTLSFHGSDKITDPTREIAIVGGTGIYRFAQGFAVITTTSSVNFSAVLHFNVTFQHSDEIRSGSSTSPGGSSSSPGGSSPSGSSAASSSLSFSSFFGVLAIAGLIHRRLAC
ncbi:dirigent protein 1 [Selaginella moellendorffii]|nr:dirigent protein 1 [Selaginella moellendorffii]|eukprot:XP_002978209.2 dirigent protein 1 [Selaginella moellendorffii]